MKFKSREPCKPNLRAKSFASPSSTESLESRDSWNDHPLDSLDLGLFPSSKGSGVGFSGWQGLRLETLGV